MSLQIKLKRDEISPSLAKQLAAARDPRAVLQAAGTQMVSITKRAFRDTSQRQQSWPDKKSGGASNLILKGMLISSIRIVSLDAKSVTVGSDRKYAAIHQLGGTILPKGKALVFTIGGKKVFAKKVTIPARPFFPFTRNGELASFAKGRVQAVMQAALAKEAGAK